MPPASTGAVHAPALIVARSLAKSFVRGKSRIQALIDVNLRLSAGRVIGLIGPDGAGKTTLMRLCAGLLVPDAGELQILGLDVASNALQVQERIGYMPQRFGLYEDLSVQENLDLFADLHGVAKSERPGRYRRLLAMSALEPFCKRLAGKLSGGMKQKLGLMCALVRSPQLLLLDEPTVGVDPISRRELWDIIHRQVEEEGMSVLLSTAYLDEAERCAEVVLIHQGAILGQGRPADFRATMRGRVWRLRPETLSSRRLQVQLQQHPAILDALVQGPQLRVLTRPGQDLDRLPDLPALDTLTISPAAPRFEDFFLATLGDGAGPLPAAPVSGLVACPGGAPSFSEERRAAAPDMIRVERLERRFGPFMAVDKISFRVRRGEIFGLLGANGAGKTTTFRMLCGLLPISGGTCTVAGVNLRSAASAARAKIGYMAQKFSLYGSLTVLDNLRFFSSAYGLRGARRSGRIRWALDSFALHPFADAPGQTLPLGYKQRLALAVALMHEPELLFLDEPTSGVDPLARREFWQQINQVAEAGVTVLITTHFMEEAEYCDRLVIMAEGRVLAEGSPESMKRDYGDQAGASMEDAFIGLMRAHQEKGRA